MNRSLTVTAVALALCWPLAALSEMSKADTQRFRDLARASLAEIEAGKLARERAGMHAVKDFAKDMVEDHGRMLDQQRSLAKKEKVTLPREPGKAQQDAMKKLRDQARGPEFDRAFMAQMVKDHQAALRLARDTAKNAKDPQLKAAAEKAVPEIRKHLQVAQQLHAQLSPNAAMGGGTPAQMSGNRP